MIIFSTNQIVDIKNRPFN